MLKFHYWNQICSEKFLTTSGIRKHFIAQVFLVEYNV